MSDAESQLRERAESDGVRFFFAMFVDMHGKPCAKMIPVEATDVLNGGGADGLTLAPLSPSNLLTPGMGAMFAFTFLSFIGFEATAIFSEEIAIRHVVPRSHRRGRDRRRDDP